MRFLRATLLAIGLMSFAACGGGQKKAETPAATDTAGDACGAGAGDACGADACGGGDACGAGDACAADPCG